MKPATTTTGKQWASRLSWMLTVTFGAALAFSGCTKGDTGPAGPAGTDAPVIESGITADPTLTTADDPPGLVFTIIGVSGQTGPTGNFQVGDKPVVTFTVEKDDGSPWHIEELASGRIWISGPTNNYQPVVAQLRDVIDLAERIDDGTYSYTFAEGIPATYAAPPNDTANYGAADGELQGQDLLDGTYTVAMAIRWNYTVDGVAKNIVGNDTFDFLLGTTAVETSHEVVGLDNCNACHEQVQAHGGGYRDPALCITCHTSGAEDYAGAGKMIEFKVMIHQIHNGAHLPSVLGVTTDENGDRIYDADPVDNIFAGRRGSVDATAFAFPVWPSQRYAMPRDEGYSALDSAAKAKEDSIRNGAVACYKCHGDADGDGPMVAPSEGAHAYSAPTRRACGSCHDDIVWEYPYTANGHTMPAQLDDSSCLSCHSVGWTTSAHAHPVADARLSPTSYQNGLNFAITEVTGSAGAYFVPGEKPVVTFTLKDNDGVDVPLYKLNRMETTVVGPTSNRQLVFPMPSRSTATLPMADFSGRLVAASTSNRGSMSRVVGSTASETLKVQFSSSTDFTVSAGESLVARGSGAMAVATNDFPAGVSITAIELTSAAVAQDITLAFSSASEFTVTGTTSGAMGSGVLANDTAASIRFTSTDESVAFTLTVGSTAITASTEFKFTVFATSSGGHIFALLPGKSAFAANDRFYYETVQNSLTTYTYNLPMDLVLEYLGDGTGVVGQTLVAGNLPVYWGRETVYERTAVAGGSSALSDASLASARYVVVDDATGFAQNDYVVIDQGGAEEYVRIGTVIGTQVWFQTPLRYNHAATVAIEEVALTALMGDVDYSLDPATGTITTINAVTAGNALVVSYRTDGAFGWYRANGDTRQDVYPAPINDMPVLGEEVGEWQALAFLDGTYTAAIWGEMPIYVTKKGETQAYNLVSEATQGDFRFGSDGDVEPYNLVASEGTCNSCHEEILFHGSHRKGVDSCLICHGTAGFEDRPHYANGGTSDTNVGTTYSFRSLIHEIHEAEIEFPAWPNGTKACSTCHGDENTAWHEPLPRNHPDQSTPTQAWTMVCSSCHSSDLPRAHMEAMTTSSGVETCGTCHSPGQLNGVDNVHKDPPPATSAPDSEG